MPARIDVHGLTFGRLTVIAEASKNSSGHRRVRCRCECGGETTCSISDLKSGTTRSCGCLSREFAGALKFRHGMARSKNTSREYTSWASAKQRCTNPTNPGYANYGGRGIRMCQAWLDSFDRFLADMGPRPRGRSLERIHNDGHYEPNNCRWATVAEQTRNTRQNRLLTYNGETMCVRDWEKRLGMKSGTLGNRITQYGWTVERALSTVPRQWGR